MRFIPKSQIINRSIVNKTFRAFRVSVVDPNRKSKNRKSLPTTIYHLPTSIVNPTLPIDNVAAMLRKEAKAILRTHETPIEDIHNRNRHLGLDKACHHGIRSRV